MRELDVVVGFEDGLRVTVSFADAEDLAARFPDGSAIKGFAEVPNGTPPARAVAATKTAIEMALNHLAALAQSGALRWNSHGWMLALILATDGFAVELCATDLAAFPAAIRRAGRVATAVRGEPSDAMRWRLKQADVYDRSPLSEYMTAREFYSTMAHFGAAARELDYALMPEEVIRRMAEKTGLSTGDVQRGALGVAVRRSTTGGWDAGRVRAPNLEQRRSARAALRAARGDVTPARVQELLQAYLSASPTDRAARAADYFDALSRLEMDQEFLRRAAKEHGYSIRVLEKERRALLESEPPAD